MEFSSVFFKNQVEVDVVDVGYILRYPLVNIQKANWKMAIEIYLVSFPMNSMVIFHSFLLTFTRPGNAGG